MKRIIVYALFFILAVWLGVEVARDPGYTLIAFRQWTLEMPLWLTLLCLFVLFFLLQISLNFFGSLLAFPQKFRRLWQKRQQQQLAQALTQGLLYLIKGEYALAEKKFIKNRAGTTLPLIHLLAASYAAILRKDFSTAIQYLSQAHIHHPEVTSALILLKAKWLLLQNEDALAVIELTPTISEKMADKERLRLLKTLFVKMQNWSALQELLPALRDIMPKAEWHEFSTYVSQQVFTHLYATQQDDAALTYYQQLPKATRQLVALREIYVRILIRLNQPETAAKEIVTQLNATWLTVFVNLYGQLQLPYLDKQWQQIEYWLRQHPHDATLLLTAGRVACHLQLWGQAKSCFEQSLALEPRPETYFLLANLLMEQFNDKMLALTHYQQGLALSVSPVK